MTDRSLQSKSLRVFSSSAKLVLVCSRSSQVTSWAMVAGSVPYPYHHHTLLRCLSCFVIILRCLFFLSVLLLPFQFLVNGSCSISLYIYILYYIHYDNIINGTHWNYKYSHSSLRKTQRSVDGKPWKTMMAKRALRPSKYP